MVAKTVDLLRYGFVVGRRLVVALFCLSVFAQAAQAQFDIGLFPPHAGYGADDLLGPEREACADETSLPGSTVLSVADPWEAILESSQGGDFLLRGGNYLIEDQLRLLNATAATPLLVKPYACETVTLTGTIRPGSYVALAGLNLQLPLNSAENWVIRLDGKNLGHLEHILLRNNRIVGGKIDALRISDDVSDVIIAGNLIDGGQEGHVLMITAEEQQHLPDQILIKNNLLSKATFDHPSEDMIQVRDVAHITIAYNSCANGRRMEQCIDIKNTTVPLHIRRNYFAGDTLHQDGPGEDGSAGCLVIHEEDGLPDNHIIQENYFENCQETTIRLGTGGSGDFSRMTFERNILIHPSNGLNEYVMAIWKSDQVVFRHNSIVRGHLKLGKSTGQLQPTDAVLDHNIFYQTRIDDHVIAPNSYTCHHNLQFQTEGTGFLQTCNAGISGDPLFVSIPAGDLHLRPGSPAAGTGLNGVDLGAYPLIQYGLRHYLPVLARP